MAHTKDTGPAEYIASLNINGLRGRMLRMPAPKNHNREILVVYGHHSSLERWWGLVQNFNTYGAVTMPDLPGLGGMDSFYKLGRKPTLDNFAEYLATFCQLRYKRRRMTIVGISFGFIVATRMLQLYPDLAKKVDLVVNAAGFAHNTDFKFSRRKWWLFRIGSRVLSWSIPAQFFRWIALNPWMLRRTYTRNLGTLQPDNTYRLPPKFEEILKVETGLWHNNHLRTHFRTTNEFLRLDNCRKTVPLPVWHIYPKDDQYCDSTMVEHHLRQIFSDYQGFQSALQGHSMSVIATRQEAATIIPAKVRRLFAKRAA